MNHVTDLLDIRKKLEILIAECGVMAQSARPGLQRSFKADGSIVTQADREIERKLRVDLPALVPGSTVWGEEQGFEEPGPGGLWVVDPVDGTSNYAFGSPLWGISIGLIRDGKVVVGAMGVPDFDEVYSAHLGGGATLNGRPLDPIQPGPIQPYELVSYGDDFVLSHRCAVPGKMRYLGAFVTEAGFLFKNVFRGVISYKANVYDVGASVAITLELGGEVRYLDGTPFTLDEPLAARRIEKPFLLFPRDSGFYG